MLLQQSKWCAKSAAVCHTLCIRVPVWTQRTTSLYHTPLNREDKPESKVQGQSSQVWSEQGSLCNAFTLHHAHTGVIVCSLTHLPKWLPYWQRRWVWLMTAKSSSHTRPPQSPPPTPQAPLVSPQQTSLVRTAKLCGYWSNCALFFQMQLLWRSLPLSLLSMTVRTVTLEMATVSLSKSKPPTNTWSTAFPW